MALQIVERNDNATSFGSESIVYLAECDTSAGVDQIIEANKWVKFPCVIEESLSMEPKTGELLDDRGRVVYNYSQPSKVKYTGNIFQRDAETFEFLRNCSSTTFAMWVVVGMIGNSEQRILMYGKLGGNYTENMNADPKIPIEFSCMVNPVNITGTKPIGDTTFSLSTILLKANQMVVKRDAPPVVDDEED